MGTETLWMGSPALHDTVVILIIISKDAKMSILVCISEPAEKSLECIINTNTGSLNPPVKKWKWVWSLDNLYYHPNCYQILTIMTLIILREIIFEKSFQIFFLRKHSIIKSFLEVIFDNQYQCLVFSAQDRCQPKANCEEKHYSWC